MPYRPRPLQIDDHYPPFVNGTIVVDWLRYRKSSNEVVSSWITRIRSGAFCVAKGKARERPREDGSKRDSVAWSWVYLFLTVDESPSLSRLGS